MGRSIDSTKCVLSTSSLTTGLVIPHCVNLTQSINEPLEWITGAIILLDWILHKLSLEHVFPAYTKSPEIVNVQARNASHFGT